MQPLTAHNLKIFTVLCSLENCGSFTQHLRERILSILPRNQKKDGGYVRVSVIHQNLANDRSEPLTALTTVRGAT